jgi:hypothetical protein
MAVMPACRPDQIFAMRADAVIAILLAKADVVEQATLQAVAAMKGGGGDGGSPGGLRPRADGLLEMQLNTVEDLALAMGPLGTGR